MKIVFSHEQEFFLQPLNGDFPVAVDVEELNDGKVSFEDYYDTDQPIPLFWKRSDMAVPIGSIDPMDGKVSLRHNLGQPTHPFLLTKD